jgi:hypothetical protein
MKRKNKRIMEAKVEKTPWSYHVHVSKDSPNNINRGSFDRLPDNEYWRGYYYFAQYTDLKDAEKTLSYFQKGFIEKRRTVISHGRYGQGYRQQSETIKIKEL